MNVVYERCCGLDVHKKSVVACLITPGSGSQGTPTPNGSLNKEIRTFGTMTADLLALCDWLHSAGCTHVAMESTGIYWKPVYNLLEGQFEVLVVNAAHIKAVPGRKTDVRDAEWIADLLQHGLLKPSFIPPSEQRELRDLTRYRSTLIAERSRTANRLQKVLEDANIKLASVTTDVLGMSGRDMLAAILEGETDSLVLAQLARGRLREKHEQLVRALAGRVRAHHRFLIAEHLSHIDYLDEAIERVSAQIEEQLRPFEEELARLDTIPGISRRAAEVLLAEIGADMSRFASAGHLASWAGMCPGNNESAGKRISGRTRKGSPWLRQVLVEAAHGASHTKNSYLSAQYRRLAARRGRKKALIAVGHSILVMAYYVLTRKETYQDLGGNYFDERERQAVERRLVRRLERLGYQVSLQPIGQAA
jgi:transposase